MFSINLCLSSACRANCIFCPADRGKNISQKHMPLDIFYKIVDEMASPEFRKVQEVWRMEISENGDCFLNPDILVILRYIKKNLPWITVECYTNFQVFTPPLIDVVLKEGLVGSLFTNVDGLENSYPLVKGLPFEPMIENFSYFLQRRAELGSS